MLKVIWWIVTAPFRLLWWVLKILWWVFRRCLWFTPFFGPIFFIWDVLRVQNWWLCRQQKKQDKKDKIDDAKVVDGGAIGSFYKKWKEGWGEKIEIWRDGWERGMEERKSKGTSSQHTGGKS